MFRHCLLFLVCFLSCFSLAVSLSFAANNGNLKEAIIGEVGNISPSSPNVQLLPSDSTLDRVPLADNLDNNLGNNLSNNLENMLTQDLTLQAEEAQKAGNYARAVALWEELAKSGDAQAMNRLGVLYDNGVGVEPDAGRAVYWYAQAAAAGNPLGMSNYGRMLQLGQGVQANANEAARWLYLAARQGVREAQYNLGVLYESGSGVPQDDKAAAAWYGRSAAQEQPEALARFGHFFRTGRGVEKNLSRATLLLYRAAMEGNINAMRELKELARENPPKTKDAILFGQRLDSTDREKMRKALNSAGLEVLRESDDFICDVYKTVDKIPGANQLAACYGKSVQNTNAPLGFVKIDYPASSREFITKLNKMMTQRFGDIAANEGDASLWNLGDVIVATQYMPEHQQVGLMYMIPEVYHLTQKK